MARLPAPTVLPEQARAEWLEAFDQAYGGRCKAKLKRDQREACAAAMAWGKLKETWRKDQSGNWVQRTSGIVFELPDLATFTLQQAQRVGVAGLRKLPGEPDDTFRRRSTARRSSLAKHRPSQLARTRAIVERMRASPSGPPTKPTGPKPNPRLDLLGFQAWNRWRVYTHARRRIPMLERRARRRLLQRASATNPEIGPDGPSWFNAADQAAQAASHRQIVNALTPVLVRDLRYVVAEALSPDAVNLAVSEAAQAKPLAQGRLAWAAVIEALDSAEARLINQGQVADLAQLARAKQMVLARLADHFGGSFEPPERSSVAELMSDKSALRAARWRAKQRDGPPRSEAEVLRAVQAMRGPYEGLYDEGRALRNPSRVRQVVRASVGLDRRNESPLAAAHNPWPSAPIPHLANAAPGTSPSRSVFQTPNQMPASDRPDGLQFTTRAMADFYDESVQRKLDQGVPILATNPDSDIILQAIADAISQAIAGIMRAPPESIS